MAQRIDWTEDERKKWFDASIEMLRQVKFKIPKNWKDLAEFMKIVRQAQVVLAENRRRPMGNTDAIKIDLPNFHKAGFLPPDVQPLKKAPPGGRKDPTDPNVIRINALADERDKALQMAADAETTMKEALQENVVLKERLSRVPTEAQVLKGFIVDILAEVAARGRSLPGPSSEDINKVVRETLHVPRPKHDPQPPPVEKSKKPVVAIFNSVDNKIPNFDKWQQEFPDLAIRAVDVRGDGKVSIPLGAFEVLLIHGVRHATTSDVREVYPHARLVMPSDVPKMLTAIQARIKEQTGVQSAT